MDHREQLALVGELRYNDYVIPDGTVKDSLRMPRGYWEAKDTYDDLDTEIQRKFNRGYPRDNIIFEDSQTAVLIQNREEVMRAKMDKPGELHRLIRSFLDYELPQIDEFRKAQDQFKADLPAVIANLRDAIGRAEDANAEYQEAAAEFLALCRLSISPAVSDDHVREMLLQHILTKDIFLRVFAEDQFHRENDIARQINSLEQTFFTGNERRQAIARLHAYYGAIGRAADTLADFAEKQGFLKAIYEDFYQAYNPAAADRLGVVYTPNEIVDFIILGVDHLLRKHFRRRLADDNVQILDPATGTGTFITNLIDYLPANRRKYKYLNEIHANEVAILPYYIANLNIEYTYKEKTGHYVEFPNLCFVDTLDNMDWVGATGGSVTRQAGFNLGGLSVDNWIRIQEQNDKTISVIIGNPPYYANQSNWNDLNPKRPYPDIDRRIAETYIKESSAQKTKQYDMYKRFIRWASDRLADNGIIAFVTNRAYLDAHQDDGFRKVADREFSAIYVLDLGSDVRRNPKISGKKNNVFGIQTGVAITFFVRDMSNVKKCSIYYARREDAELAVDKLAYLREVNLSQIAFDTISPDKEGYWLDQSKSDFDTLIALADKQTKLARKADDQKAVFALYSLGMASNRDGWVYDFNASTVADKMYFFCRTYRNDLRRFKVQQLDAESVSTWTSKSIKWTAELEKHLINEDVVLFSEHHIVPSLYRPFVTKHCYYAPIITHRRYQMPNIFPHGIPGENKVICFRAKSKAFFVLAADKVVDLHFTGDTQCLPLHRYTDDGRRISNITEWGLSLFRDRYEDESISADDVFAYTYATLHDPAYRESYAVDLQREFPRLPLYEEFDRWADMGRELLHLHIGFESAEPWSLVREESIGGSGRVRLKADKDRGIIALDDTTSLSGVPEAAWRYQLGTRSALEWVLDQYKERKPSDPTIKEHFNTYKFADHKETVIDLLRRVCTVSVRTMNLVEGMRVHRTTIQTDA